MTSSEESSALRVNSLGWLLACALLLTAVGGAIARGLQSGSGRVVAASARQHGFAIGQDSRGRRNYPRHLVVAGRLPNRQGFGIWVQRYRFAGSDHLQLIATIVPPARSMAAITRELNGGQYGSATTDFTQFTAPDDLIGLVGCTSHPVVLLYGLTDGFASASFRADGQGMALQWALPANALGLVKAPGIAWGVSPTRPP